MTSARSGPLGTVAVVALALGALAGCSATRSDAPSKPDASSSPATAASPTPSSEVLEPGVVVHELTAERAGKTIRVWLYEPEGAQGDLPAVLIGPAGSPLISGMSLSEGDRAEHLPWVRAGDAVIAYDVEGPLASDAGEREVARAMKQYRDANYGVADASAALDLALDRPGLIDPQRIVAVGHSSAAALALMVTAADSRVTACVGFAPATDINENLDDRSREYLSGLIPDFDGFVRDGSARSVVDRVSRPVLLFHADDDAVVTKASFDAFAAALTAVNPQVTVRTAGSGGHYESMVDEGIPAAIEWVNDLFGVGVPSQG